MYAGAQSESYVLREVMSLLIALLYYLHFSFASCGTSPGMQRVVGGVPTTIAKLPYQVALYLDDQFTCGGSLLTKNCVLTAGHCVAGRSPATLKVRGGITLLSTIGGETRQVANTFVPEKFDYKTLNMDVAILKLTASLSGTNISTIVLNTSAVQTGEQLQISGWGFTNENSKVISNKLRAVMVRAISHAECNREYPGDLKETMFCAGSRSGGKDSCTGDSGGPVVRNGQQVGIVSWGNGCGRARFPGVYTSIRHTVSWVNVIKAGHCD